MSAYGRWMDFFHQKTAAKMAQERMAQNAQTNRQQISTSGDIAKQRLSNQGNFDVQGLRNKGGLAEQGLRNQGQLANTGLQNQGSLNTQALRNRGQMDVTNADNSSKEFLFGKGLDFEETKFFANNRLANKAQNLSTFDTLSKYSKGTNEFGEETQSPKAYGNNLYALGQLSRNHSIDPVNKLALTSSRIKKWNVNNPGIDPPPGLIQDFLNLTSDMPQEQREALRDSLFNRASIEKPEKVNQQKVSGQQRAPERSWIDTRAGYLSGAKGLQQMANTFNRNLSIPINLIGKAGRWLNQPVSSDQIDKRQ